MVHQGGQGRPRAHEGGHPERGEDLRGLAAPHGRRELPGHHDGLPGPGGQPADPVSAVHGVAEATR